MGTFVGFPTPRDKSRGTISRFSEAAGFNPRDGFKTLPTDHGPVAHPPAGIENAGRRC